MEPEQASGAVIIVEQEAPQKFKIQTDQLEQIGAKLRGPRHFSVFHSVVLPAFVAVLTTLVTGTFQYLSWLNSVRLQAAAGVADRADQTLQKAADMVGQRMYATVVFVPSVRDLAQAGGLEFRKLPLETAASALSEVKAAPGEAMAKPSQGAVAPLLPINPVQNDLRKRRFEHYYSRLEAWNEKYDEILADIDSDLDAPILATAGSERTAMSVFFNKIKDVNCHGSLTEELDRFALDRHSLKLQFAVINRCFGKLHGQLDEQMTRLASGKIASIAPAVFADAADDVNHIRTVANQFRCAALLRVRYYKTIKERSIVIPTFIRNAFFLSPQAEATKEFKDEDQGCSAVNRPT